MTTNPYIPTLVQVRDEEIARDTREFLADVTVSGDLYKIPLHELQALIERGNALAWSVLVDDNLRHEALDTMRTLRRERDSRTPNKETAITCSHIKPIILDTTPDTEAFPFIGALIHGTTVVEIDKWIGRKAIHNLKVQFTNRYTASINHLGDGYWEIAVMRGGKCVYDTDIMDNRLIRTGDPLHVAEVVARIAALPRR